MNLDQFRVHLDSKIAFPTDVTNYFMTNYQSEILFLSVNELETDPSSFCEPPVYMDNPRG